MVPCGHVRPPDKQTDTKSNRAERDTDKIIQNDCSYKDEKNDKNKAARLPETGKTDGPCDHEHIEKTTSFHNTSNLKRPPILLAQDETITKKKHREQDT
jgi:hypothetical protein